MEISLAVENKLGRWPEISWALGGNNSYTVFAFWCGKRGLVCMCFEPFTPSRKYGAEFPERSSENDDASF